MTNRKDFFTVTEQLAKEFNFLFIKEVADMAGLYEKEIILELKRRGVKPTNDPNKGALNILSIVLESYKQELLVYVALQNNKELPIKLPKQLAGPEKILLTWKDVFYSDHKHHGDISIVRKLAVESGYPMYCWNGRVYPSNEENTMKDLGTLEELGLS